MARIVAFVVAHEWTCQTANVRRCSCEWEYLVVDVGFEATGTVADRILQARMAVLNAARERYLSS